MEKRLNYCKGVVIAHGKSELLLAEHIKSEQNKYTDDKVCIVVLFCLNQEARCRAPPLVLRFRKNMNGGQANGKAR